MKKLIACLLLSMPIAAMADSFLLLQAPHNPTPGLFGHNTDCYVTGASADDNFAGVCKYAAYGGASASAVVEWASDGTATYLYPCHVLGQQTNAGAPNCPIKQYGPLMTYPDGKKVFVKVVIGDIAGGALDSYPVVPVLVLP